MEFTDQTIYALSDDVLLSDNLLVQEALALVLRLDTLMRQATGYTEFQDYTYVLKHAKKRFLRRYWRMYNERRDLRLVG
jgi:hypothetical protein